MSVTFQLETWQSFYPDGAALFLEHYEEIIAPEDRERAQLDLDVATYEKLYELGFLQILTARDDKILVGYQITIIKTHIHFKKMLCAYEDSYFLTKPYRKGSLGIRLIKEALRHIKLRGVQKIIFMNDYSKDVQIIFERLGFKETGKVYTLWT